MINVTSEELERILTTIEEALILHEKWLANLHRILACRLTPTEADMAEDAHRRCAFGHWFYSKGNSGLRKLAVFGKIGEMHEAMHDSAREICMRFEVMGKAPLGGYDEFIEDMEKFREELVGLRHKVSYTLQNIDPLSGAFNHIQLLPDLKAEQQRLKESGAQYSLLLMDLDLKEINKSHGHEMGDKVLRTTILSIREALSPGDKIYRYDGAEFVICLPGKSTSDAERIKEQLLKKMGEALVETTGESDAHLQINYGVVELNPDAYLEELLDRSSRSTYTITL